MQRSMPLTPSYVLPDADFCIVELAWVGRGAFCSSRQPSTILMVRCYGDRVKVLT